MFNPPPASPIVEEASSSFGKTVVHHDLEPQTSQAKVETHAGDVEANDTSPVSSGGTLAQWNKPKINVFRFVVANFCFIILGMNDGALGVRPNHAHAIRDTMLIPSLGFDPICKRPSWNPPVPDEAMVAAANSPTDRSVLQYFVHRHLAALSISLRRLRPRRPD